MNLCLFIHEIVMEKIPEKEKRKNFQINIELFNF